MFLYIFRPAVDSSVRTTSSDTSPSVSHSSSSERRSSSATRQSSASHRHRDRANTSSHRHSTSSLNPPRVHSARAALTTNNVTSGNNSNSEDNSQSETEFPRRRSTRRRNYLNRNQLHNAVDLPQGYGKYYLYPIYTFNITVATDIRAQDFFYIIYFLNLEILRFPGISLI